MPITQSRCDPAALDAVNVALASNGRRLLGLKTDVGHITVAKLTGVRVCPVVRFYTTLWGACLRTRTVQPLIAQT